MVSVPGEVSLLPRAGEARRMDGCMRMSQSREKQEPQGSSPRSSTCRVMAGKELFLCVSLSSSGRLGSHSTCLPGQGQCRMQTCVYDVCKIQAKCKHTNAINSRNKQTKERGGRVKLRMVQAGVRR